MKLREVRQTPPIHHLGIVGDASIEDGRNLRVNRTGQRMRDTVQRMHRHVQTKQFRACAALLVELAARHPPRQPGPSRAFRSPINADDGVTRSETSSSSVVIRSPLMSRRCTCDVPG